jgi:hypothetical protein
MLWNNLKILIYLITFAKNSKYNMIIVNFFKDQSISEFYNKSINDMRKKYNKIKDKKIQYLSSNTTITMLLQLKNKNYCISNMAVVGLTTFLQLV